MRFCQSSIAFFAIFFMAFVMLAGVKAAPMVAPREPSKADHSTKSSVTSSKIQTHSPSATTSSSQIPSPSPHHISPIQPECGGAGHYSCD
ncbi:hypothetical protein SISNIDRAFT_551081 [Sistotremastrum niveocremeum HHB9708]|uniref:Uncharacterized protein n=2 Tax=Sistotremastraceae TaxID=3402574 RepID=A0A164S9D2_9AGAM|nr:hypothetical protein SISNIDRAFT_551081 [Sistotremastrum niveocremeum HHB9708]KZT34307.1 hypothetical protein SISSUDRAFT_1131954 [Sistotremastrum suecicum HHB10207 ss-3]